MAHSVSDDCIKCGSCAAACPTGAIKEGEKKYEVDPNTCVDCGACESGCPTGAIKQA